MTAREKAESRLSCFYAAVNAIGVNSAQLRVGKEWPKRPTTEEVLAEAKKISEWVLDVKGDAK